MCISDEGYRDDHTNNYQQYIHCKIWIRTYHVVMTASDNRGGCLFQQSVGGGGGGGVGVVTGVITTFSTTAQLRIFA